MAELSEEDCITIQKYSLEAAVGHLRTTLRRVLEPNPETEESLDEEDAGSDETEADEDFDPKDAISTLLTALQSHRVAKKLHSHESRGTARGGLADLVKRLDSGEIDAEAFRLLVSAVVQRKSDVDIWKEVLRLIASASRLTPPPSVSAAFGGTPRTYSSASLHVHGAVKAKDVENVLREELGDCTFVGVQGVFEKHFEDRAWTGKSMEIYHLIKSTSYADGRWTTFPSHPTEAAVWTWWSKVQDEYFQDSRNMYYTTRSATELKGLDNKSQLDIFVKKRRIAEDVQVQHDWADICVVGEHTVSENRGDKFLQLARYAYTVFRAQPRRVFVLGFVLSHTLMELYSFDRSGAYGAEQFDIHKEPERFIRVVCGYSMMSDEELGFDTFVQRQPDSTRLSITVDDEDSGDHRTFAFNSIPIASRAAIVGRNTNCYTTADQQNIVKFSWVSASRIPTEIDLLRLASARKVKGIPELVGHRRIVSTNELRSQLVFSKKRRGRGRLYLRQPRSESSLSSQLAFLPLSQSGRKRRSDSSDQSPSKKSRSNSQASRLSQILEPGDSFDNSQASQASQGLQTEPYVNRVLYCHVTKPAGRPLTDFKTARMLLQALRDAIKGHRSLFLDGKILHRDVSASNIVITDPSVNEGRFGMLIDIELGTMVEDGKNSRTEGQRMTGTLKYMAIEVVWLGFCKGKVDIEHTYRHDLESFFYVFLDMCINYGWPKGKGPKRDGLRDWCIGSLDSIFTTKLGHMGLDGFEKLVLTKFSPMLQRAKGLAVLLRDVLFLRLPSGKLATGTPDEPAHVLYDNMIAAFDTSIEAWPKEGEEESGVGT